MPGFDRTGPAGAGPMTGGAWGHCSPADAGHNPRFTGGFGYGRGLGLRRGFRRGFGPDRGRGRGFGPDYGVYAPAVGTEYSLSKAEEMEALRANAEYIQKSLTSIRKRIDELEEKSSEEP